MNQGLVRTIQEFYEHGKTDEAFVMSLLEKAIGGKAFPSTKSEDVKNHIDLWWDSPKGIRVSMDVKGPHRSRRSDSGYDEAIHWVELANTSGDKGSLYGDADYIAFRGETRTVFVKRKKLLDHILERTDGVDVVYENPKGCYVPYQRKKWGRKDIIVKIPDSDIEQLSHFIISHVPIND